MEEEKYKQFINDKITQFYKECTDGVDEENEFYDAQFEGTQPYKVETFIRKMFSDFIKLYF